MLRLSLLAALLGLLTTYVSATALTFKLYANERECFYTDVRTEGAKIAFYFAVQSGGSFDGKITLWMKEWMDVGLEARGAWIGAD